MKKYGIIKVHYFENDKTKHIEKVKAISCYSYWEGGTEEELSTSDVVKLINDKATVITLLKKDGKWTEGSKVEVYDKIYIRSEKDSTEADNLDKLPTY